MRGALTLQLDCPNRLQLETRPALPGMSHWPRWRERRLLSELLMSSPSANALDVGGRSVMGRFSDLSGRSFSFRLARMRASPEAATDAELSERLLVRERRLSEWS